MSEPGKNRLEASGPREWIKFGATVALWFSLVFAHLNLQGQEDPVPALRLNAELSWSQPYGGDALRVKVRLTSPRARRDMQRQWTQSDQTNSAFTPYTMPGLDTNWAAGATLNLYRLESIGPRQPVLIGAQWNAYLRPQVAELPDFEGLLAARSREWLAAPDALGLRTGHYILEASWNGSGLVEAPALPPDGVLTAPVLEFDVVSALTDVQRAIHSGRLAFYEYMGGRYQQARVYSQEALRLNASTLDPENIDVYFIAAHSALRLKDYLGMADAYQSLERLLPAHEAGELPTMLRGRLDLLAPRLQVPPGAQNQVPFQVQIAGWPEQRYVTYGSMDLRNWSPVSTNQAQSNLVQVIDWNSPDYFQRYYRSIWTP